MRSIGYLQDRRVAHFRREWIELLGPKIRENCNLCCDTKPMFRLFTQYGAATWRRVLQAVEALESIEPGGAVH